MDPCERSIVVNGGAAECLPPAPFSSAGAMSRRILCFTEGWSVQRELFLLSFEHTYLSCSLKGSLASFLSLGYSELCSCLQIVVSWISEGREAWSQESSILLYHIILFVDRGFRYRKEFLFYKAIIQLSKFQESCIQITSLSLFPTLKKNPELILRGKVEVFKSKMVMVFIVYNIFFEAEEMLCS